MPAPATSWAGINSAGGCNGCAPPDTNGDVGRTQYVQIVNSAFQVWNKTGASLYGPANINTLFTGFGGPCETRNDGDPVVLYDQLADRWVITQFTAAARRTESASPSRPATTPPAPGIAMPSSWAARFLRLSQARRLARRLLHERQRVQHRRHRVLGPQPIAFNRSAMLAGTAATFVRPQRPAG